MIVLLSQRNDEFVTFAHTLSLNLNVKINIKAYFLLIAFAFSFAESYVE